jgi:secreted PhoX family phosphatase
VVRYAVADLAASGSPTPAVVLKSPDLTNPAGLAFDKTGALWVTNDALGTDAKVVKFTAAHLGASYTGPGDVVLTATSGPPVTNSYTSPGPLAFDKDGNLWVGFDVDIVKFTAAQLGASAEISAPFVQKLDVLALPTSLLFDESGGLWIVGAQGTFLRVPAASLARSATPRPTSSSPATRSAPPSRWSLTRPRPGRLCTTPSERSRSPGARAGRL